MAYVQYVDSQLGLAPVISNVLTKPSSLGVRGFWANAKTRMTTPGYANRRPGGVAADWRFFVSQTDAQVYAAGGKVTVTETKPPVIVVPVKPPTVDVTLPGKPYIPPSIPPESKPGGSNYRFEGNLAYPLNQTGAQSMPPAMSNQAGWKWTKRIFPIERYGFIWEWKFVPPPESVVIGPPIISVPPAVGGDTVIPGGDRPNIVQPPGNANVYPIAADGSAGQYYNFTTGEVRQGRRLLKNGIWFSYPPDDSGNWLIRDEAVRQGYISMTGQAGVQTAPGGGVVTGGAMPAVPTDSAVQQAGMNPWLIGGLAVAALFLLGGKKRAT